MEASHSAHERPSIGELVANYAIDENFTRPSPRVIGIVDDVLTTGAHFKAMREVLSGRFPDVMIVGIFLARRAPESADITFGPEKALGRVGDHEKGTAMPAGPV
ncbi:MAG: hypothetical protein HY822_09365 [Acidobacteria bacterium]|nr:hypothetical protein [Acidobacteriota bacterium]